ncbi:IS1595 family transposase [Pontimicrobium aquaticum]|uniref:IS1595 family transposase n=1 Tax=Pontimicrobium aquaticum TaxID=2565367 RepID=A0A4U0F054_9FLAO|nr:IS1595 family transposase [Pontimicrobium aquaticum]TJY37713.1 IS1595 family transposase [Pontimicrobium aquaticum]
MNFKSLPQLLDYFKEESTCLEYYAQIRWNGKPVCPHCDSERVYTTNRGYKCANNECYKKFTVKVGTIFHNSKISLRIWFAAIYLATTHKKGISSVQLAIDLGITQKTAWFVLHRIREMLKEKAPQMLGENNMVEVDEAYIGGKESNKHISKRRSFEDKNLTNEGKPFRDKKIVVGLIERNGNVVLKHVPKADANNMVAFINKHVPEGSTVYSDEASVYRKLHKTYTHESVKHALSIYVEGSVHTNTIENFWSVLKRGLYGIYHQVSEKHLERYLDEFSARFNTRSLTSQERFEKFLVDSESILSYKRLTCSR